MAPTWSVRPLREPAEIEQILALQQANLAPHVGAEEAAAQGFVTAVHSAEILQRMHELGPSLVAVSGEAVVGYALTMLLEARRHVPILEPMFELLGGLRWRGRQLGTLPFYVMGQVCVAKAFRGQGIFDALYQGHRDTYRDRFELIVTEVSLRNPRSLRAHERVGFEPLHRYRDDVDEWVILGWDFSPPAGA